MGLAVSWEVLLMGAGLADHGGLPRQISVVSWRAYRRLVALGCVQKLFHILPFKR